MTFLAPLAASRGVVLHGGSGLFVCPVFPVILRGLEGLNAPPTGLFGGFWGLEGLNVPPTGAFWGVLGS